MRFEEELKKANEGINKRSGTKKYEKVIERVGRALQKYPSIAKFYNIQYTRDENDATKMKSIEWELKDPSSLEKSCGVKLLHDPKIFLQKSEFLRFNMYFYHVYR